MKRLHPSSSGSFSATPSVRLASSKEDQAWFDAQLDSFHGLGATTPIGDFLRQIVEIDSKPVALLAWGPACYALKDRDRWISWSAPQRVARLKLVVQNRRFLILSPKGASPNLASQAMGAALRALPDQWMEVFGYQPLLAESFTDPEGYAGTTYKATNWQVLGTTQGYARSRLDFYVPNESPKRLWCLELHPKARSILRSQILPEAYSKALSTVPQGLLPLSTGQFETLRKAFAAVPDPRRKAGNHQRTAVLAHFDQNPPCPRLPGLLRDSSTRGPGRIESGPQRMVDHPCLTTAPGLGLGREDGSRPLRYLESGSPHRRSSRSHGPVRSEGGYRAQRATGRG